MEFDPENLARGLEIDAADSLMPAILETVAQSRAHIDLVYRLEGGTGDRPDAPGAGLCLGTSSCCCPVYGRALIDGLGEICGNKIALLARSRVTQGKASQTDMLKPSRS